MIGQTVSHYRVLEQIGAGGMGVVYRARDERLERDVALKVLSPVLVQDEAFLLRFRREARLLSKLNHPNIATVHDFDTVAGTTFLVMEFIQGETLDHKLASGPLRESELLRVAIQLLQGLRAAHEEGIVHRDLKPSNLKETPDGRLKILDFGLARTAQSDIEATQSTTATAGVVGTLPYMSPEQLRGDPVDARTDIYSAGVVLYELATGQRPFTETLAPRLIDCILHRTATLPRELNPQVSTGLEAIVRKAIEKEPQRRYNSARDMCGELQRLAGGSIDTPREAAPPEYTQAPPMEIAHVLFTDIVGYSKLPMDEQQGQLRRLQTLVRETPEFVRARSQDQLISLPTGDGMALVFFGEPESAAKCAVELGQRLRDQPDIELRMGINSGPVYRLADINANRNVAGGGINTAQSVMDCGDAGHILVSKAVADVLGQLSNWQGRLQDLGEAEVKHGVRVHIFNLLTAEVGNPATPKKFLPETTPARSARTIISSKNLFAMGVVVTVVVAVAVTFFRPNLSVVHARRPKIAILGFKNLTSTPENDWVGTSLDSMLSAELMAGDHVVTVPGETVARAITDLGLPNVDSYGPETLARVRKMLDCDYVVYGSYFDTGRNAGGRLQVQFHLQKTDSGELVVSAPQAGNEIAIPELSSTIGATLRGRLGLPGISSKESEEIQAAIPSTPEARVFYSQGLAQMRTLDLLAARTSFEQAIVADQNFSLAHANLAEVWKRLGYDEKAKAQAQTAFELSAHLGNEDRISVEALYREMNSEWEKSIDLYRSLWIVSREQTPEYAYRAADVQIRAGKATEALQTVAALRKQPGELVNSPVIDLREAEAYESLGEPQKEAAAAKMAAEGARGLGARFLEAEALWRVCGALAALGDISNATVACDHSLDIAKATKNKLLVARALTNLGNIASGHGDYAAALPLHREALEIARALGSQRDVVGALTNIADVLSNQGDHTGAEKNYQAAMRIATEINDRAAILKLQNDLAAERETAGDFAKALEYFQQSLSAAESNHDRGGIVDAKTNIGSLKALRGELAGGLALVQEALVQSDEFGLKDKSAQLRLIMGDIVLRQGELDSAEKSYRQALEQSEKLGDASLKATSQLALGNLALERGSPAEAEQLSTEAAAAFHAAPNSDMECSALLVRVSALMELKRYSEAEAALADAEKLRPQDRETQLTVTLTAGRLEARQGKYAVAKRGFAQVEREAARMGLREMEYRVALAQGELSLLEGNKVRAKMNLQQLEKEARARGYHGIEKRAKALQTGAV